MKWHDELLVNFYYVDVCVGSDISTIVYQYDNNIYQLTQKA